MAVALDQLGRRLDQIELATTRAGYERLLAWAESLGVVEAFGVEGTGCYGAALVRRDDVERRERDGLTIAEHAEIRELRRQVRRPLEEEKLILQKAAYFARGDGSAAITYQLID